MSQEVATLARYRIGPAHSRFTVQAFAGGLLSFLGHSPTFAVRDFAGELLWGPGADDRARLDVTVRADSLEVLDNVRPADREEIEGRMRREVLETTAFPDVRFTSDRLATENVRPERYRLHISGGLSLHGSTNRETIETELQLYNDGVRLTGNLPLRMSAYQVRPVTALGGAIQLQDQLRLAFDLVAMKEGP